MNLKSSDYTWASGPLVQARHGSGSSPVLALPHDVFRAIITRENVVGKLFTRHREWPRALVKNVCG